MLLDSDELARALARDYRTAQVAKRDRAMLDYAAKLTLTPQTVSAADVEKLRAAGFDDTSILDICQVVSYYAYVNRLADGLGVELEASWTEDQLTMSREELAAAAAVARARQGG